MRPGVSFEVVEKHTFDINFFTLLPLHVAVFWRGICTTNNLSTSDHFSTTLVNTCVCLKNETHLQPAAADDDALTYLYNVTEYYALDHTLAENSTKFCWKVHVPQGLCRVGICALLPLQLHLSCRPFVIMKYHMRLVTVRLVLWKNNTVERGVSHTMLYTDSVGSRPEHGPDWH